MIATIGFILAIGLLVYMIIRGIDMITATVVTAAVILVTSGLNVWDGFLTTYSGGIGSFVTSWFLILGLGGVFGQLVLEAGLATRIAKTPDRKAGSKDGGSRHPDLQLLHHAAGNQRLHHGVCAVSDRG